MNKITC